MARVLEQQTKLPFTQMVYYLQAIYMLGYLQSGTEACEELRQMMDSALQVMSPST